jgi:hypothetical protein
MWHWFGFTLATLVGGVLGWLLARRESVGAGFAALGAVTGLMIGLSTSPVVAASVSTILGLLGVLVPIYFQRLAAAPAQPPPAADAQPAPPPLGTWLFPFAGALLTGTLAGVALRANDALNFASRSLRDQYQAQGFTEDQITAMMERHAKAVTGPPPRTAENPGPTLLHSLPRPATWDDIWSKNYRDQDTADENLARIEAASPKDVQQAIANLRAEGKSAAEILDALKRAFTK